MSSEQKLRGSIRSEIGPSLALALVVNPDFININLEWKLEWKNFEQLVVNQTSNFIAYDPGARILTERAGTQWSVPQWCEDVYSQGQKTDYRFDYLRYPQVFFQILAQMPRNHFSFIQNLVLGGNRVHFVDKDNRRIVTIGRLDRLPQYPWQREQPLIVIKENRKYEKLSGEDFKRLVLNLERGEILKKSRDVVYRCTFQTSSSQTSSSPAAA